MSVRHIVLVGAARSGTKIFRDALAQVSEVGRVPYDIGYVWRAGNESWPDDVIAPARVGARARRLIRTFVDRYAQGEPPVVIEKTVGNTLRVPTVASVFPDVAFVHLIRDGVDVAESARRQWSAPSDWRYIVGKARHFPLRLMPRYGVKYARSLLHRRSHARVGSWGPRYPGIDADLRECDLLAVCARQWRHSVESATRDLARLNNPVIEVRYEDFVTSPAEQLERVVTALGLRVAVPLDQVADTITAERRGAGRGALSNAELELLHAEIGPLLQRLRYQPAGPRQSHD